MTSSSRPKTPGRLRRLAALLVAVALTASACGTSGEEDSTTAQGTVAGEDAPTGLDEGLSLGESSGQATSESDTVSAESDAEAAAPQTTQAPVDEAASEAVSPEREVTRTRLGDKMVVASSIETGRFEGRLTVVDDAELPAGLELVFQGSYDTANQASEVSLDFAAIAMAAAEAEGTDLGPFAAMLEEPMVVRTVGASSYVSWGLLTLLTGGQGSWIEAEADQAGDLTSSFGAPTTGSPTDFLAVLEEANADITELGTEQIRGVDTTHLRALVDLAELDESLSEEDRATLERDLGSLDVSAFPIDFWIDEDGLIRRYSMSLDQSAGGANGPSEASLVFEFFDYGADITIEAPPADEVISADELDLEGFGFGN